MTGLPDDSGFDAHDASAHESERRAQRILTAVIAALMAAGLGYRILVMGHLQHTSLVFIGIPAVTAFALLRTRPQTAIGTINKVIALLLCMSGVVFGEGLVCILFAAPIFFLVGTIVGYVINRVTGTTARDDPRRHWSGLVALAVLPFSAEGALPGFEFGRDEQVEVTRVVTGDVGAVRSALAAEPRFDRPLPTFLRLGFPTPMHTTGSGLAVGDRRAITFSHGRHHSGALVMTVASVDSGSVRFAAVNDSSYITHWLAWRDATVHWQQVDRTHTRVTWTLRYRRRLDPAWYFAPLERYGVSVAAAYLIETLATPGVIPSAAPQARNRAQLSFRASGASRGIEPLPARVLSISTIAIPHAP